MRKVWPEVREFGELLGVTSWGRLPTSGSLTRSAEVVDPVNAGLIVPYPGVASALRAALRFPGARLVWIGLKAPACAFSHL